MCAFADKSKLSTKDEVDLSCARLSDVHVDSRDLLPSDPPHRLNEVELKNLLSFIERWHGVVCELGGLT